jgi:predicted outer membrane repeat protein
MINNVSGTGTNTTVQNCIFDHNIASESAGGIYDLQGHMTISGCTFQYNQGNAQRGGALYVYYTSGTAFGTVDIANCKFIQNSAGNGGAIFVKGGTGAGPNTITRSTFQQNQANDPANGDGGAIICDPTTTITSCAFSGNIAGRYGTITTYGDAGNTITVTSSMFVGNQVQYGGGICINGTSGYVGAMIITNCTFSGNTASVSGGAVYSLKALGGSSQFTITNSILWDDSPVEIAVGGSGGLPTVSYSDVDQDGYAGSNGNIRELPAFIGGANYHLTASSPCIDVGTNSAPSLPSTDIDGNARIIDGDDDGSAVADMGADEFVPSTPGWGGAATVPSEYYTTHDVSVSRILNLAAMLILPVGVLLVVTRMRRKD